MPRASQQKTSSDVWTSRTSDVRSRPPKPGPITLIILGKIPAKKNTKKVIKTRSGKWTATYGSAQQEIDRIELQIPGEVRDLNLVHPEIEFTFSAPLQNWDRDNAVTTLLDVLVKYSVLKNDSVLQCNGKIVIHPCVRGDWETVIDILPKEKE